MKGNESNQDMCPRCMTPLQGQKICPKCQFDPSTYTPAKHHLPPRTILDGKYLVGCVLGEGGFGITYVGWDLQLHTMVAIKEYFPTGIVFRDNTQSNVVSVFSGSGEEYFLHDREKFLEEARMLAKFDGNPGVVNVKNYFKENGTAYIVMEYVQGINLAVLMEQNNDKLPYDRVMRLLDLPIRTLAEMHRQNTFHRDISPENLMVTNDNVVKLIDFGSTKTNKKDKSRYLKVRPGFSPLELYTTGGQEGPFSDIYSLSATIYKAITGITPPPATDRINDDALIPPIKAGARGMSPAQEKALLKGMAVKAQDRYQRVEDLYAGLSGKSAAKSGKRKKQAPVKAVAAAVVAALAIGGGLIAANHSHVWPFQTPTPEVTGFFGVEASPLDAKMFKEAPEAFVAYSGGEQSPYELYACLTPDGLSFTRADPANIPVVDDSNGLPARTDITGDQLASDVNALYQSGLPVQYVFLQNWRFETLEPLARPWPTPIGLSFDNCEMPSDWSVLEEMGDSLNSLTVMGEADMGDLAWMSRMQGIAALTLDWRGEGDAHIDVAPIGRLERLYSLVLMNADLEDISPLADLENLSQLYLQNNHISDLSPLAGKEKMVYLQISMNPVTDLSALAGMPELEWLDMDRCDVEDISPLAGLEKLSFVALGGNRITDFAPVEHVAEVWGRDDQRVEAPVPTQTPEPESTEATAWWENVEPYAIRESAFASVPGLWEQYNGDRRYTESVCAVISPRGLELRPAGNPGALDYGEHSEQGEAERADLTPEQLASVLNAVHDLPVGELVLENWNLPTLEPLGRSWGDNVTVYIENCALPDGWAASVGAVGPGLRALWIEADMDASDLSPLNNLPDLAELFMIDQSWQGDCNLDVGAIAHLNSLTHLDLQGMALEDIGPFANLTRLTFFGVSGSHVSDLKPLEGLKNLTFINIDTNRVSDLAPLAGLSELDNLYAKNNLISDLSPLAGLTRLYHVELDGNLIGDFTPVSHVEEVTGREYQLSEQALEAVPEVYQGLLDGEVDHERQLSAVITPAGIRFYGVDMDDGLDRENRGEWTWLTDEQFGRQMDFIQMIPLPVRRVVYANWDWGPANMDRFNRDWAWLHEIEFVDCGLPMGLSEQAVWGGVAALGEGLERFGVYACDFDASQLNWLADCPNLTALHLNTGGGDAQYLMNFLGSLNRIEELTLQDLSLSDISALSNLVNLRRLCLAGNRISDIRPLANLTGLVDLDLGVNRIEDASPVANLTNLNYLGLHGNAIADLLPLQNLASLRGLELQDNRIEDLNPLSGLGELDWLNLQNNSIVDVSPLNRVVIRQNLWLAGNRIADFSPLDSLPAECVVHGRDEQRVWEEPAEVSVRDAFAACPDVYEALTAALGLSADADIDPDDYPFNDFDAASVVIWPDHVSFVRDADRSANEEDEDARGTLGAQRTREVLDALYASRMHFGCIAFVNCRIESLAALGHPWNDGVRLVFSNCVLPEDAALAIKDMGESLHVLDASGRLPWWELNWLAASGELHELSLKYFDEGVTLDASAVGGLTRLEFLWLMNCGLTDISFVSSLTDLSWLGLHVNRIEDISPLAGLGNLTTLYLSVNRVADLSPLSALSKLDYLAVDGNPVEDLSPLSGLSALEYLDVTNCPVTDFGPVTHVATVEGRG